MMPNILLFLICYYIIPNQSQNIHIDWVNIPAGTFTMGSPKSEVGETWGETQHQVTLSAFKISKYEITFAQYDKFCEETGRRKPNDEFNGRGSNPVVNITKDDAMAFADWAGGRLPTEAEWEYACRAGTRTAFHTGDKISTNEANYDGNFPYKEGSKGIYRGKPLPVGSFQPNGWDLYDMHGNVSEWISDHYAPYPTEQQVNPKKVVTNSPQIMYRGGAWSVPAIGCRCAGGRPISPQDFKTGSIGFRIVAVS